LRAESERDVMGFLSLMVATCGEGGNSRKMQNQRGIELLADYVI
jgi:hypothetical protein